MRGSLLLLMLPVLAACDETTPLVGTPIGRFAVTGVLDTTPPTPPAASEFCGFTGSADPINFQAVLSYDPPVLIDSTTSSAYQRLWVTVDSTDPREGTLAGVHFDTFAPPKPSNGDANPGVVRNVPACHNCRVTVVEEIQGDLFVHDPGEKVCTTPGGVAPEVAPATFDPTQFSSICGQVVDSVTVGQDPQATDACVCDDKNGNPLTALEPTPDQTKTCKIVYWFHGTRT